MSKIIGVTVGTPISPKAVERKLNPVKTVNGIEPDENGNVNVEGNDGITPHIGDNGNWWIGDEDTGVKAEGEKGETGPQGEPGVYILSDGESVTDAPADADVVIDPNGDGEQAVLSVNGVKPDASGNVNVEGGTGGSVAWNPIYEGKLSESVSSIVIDSTADGTPLGSLGVNELIVFGRFKLSAGSKVRVENNGLWTVGNYKTTANSYGDWNTPFCVYQKQFTGGIVVEFSVDNESYTLVTNTEIHPFSYPIKSIEIHTETADVMFSAGTFVYAYYR